MMPQVIELTHNPDQPIMVYDTPVIMVGGGVVDTKQLTPLAERYPLIAVDGGAKILEQMRVEPSVLVGDFDSVHDLSTDHIPHQIRITDQYSTDFEKALSVVDAPLIYGFGFLGNRTDHSLAAFHVMAERQDQDIVLVDPHDIAVMVKGRFQATLPQGIRVSIWSMMPQRFSASKGLVYPLDGLVIGTGHTLGTSNQVVIPADEQDTDIDVVIDSAEQQPFLVLMAPEALKAF